MGLPEKFRECAAHPILLQFAADVVALLYADQDSGELSGENTLAERSGADLVDALSLLVDRYGLTPEQVTRQPQTAKNCECEQPGFYHCGVPGILARLEDGRLAPGAEVQRCDMCERYPSDEAALERLRELGIA